MASDHLKQALHVHCKDEDVICPDKVYHAGRCRLTHVDANAGAKILKDQLGFKEGDDHTESKGFHQCKRRQKNKVPRGRMTFPIQQPEINEGTKERDIERPSAKDIVRT